MLTFVNNPVKSATTGAAAMGFVQEEYVTVILVFLGKIVAIVNVLKTNTGIKVQPHV